ncbi:MAG: acyltransferase [Promethearchaeota archaeon]|jgi:acetyltransferase-like isoleucine patch superfamily enzyme
MFQPASLKGDSPTPIDEKIRSKYLVIYLLIIILSFIPGSIFEYVYIVYLWREGLYLLFFLLLPFNFFILIYILQLGAIFFSLLSLIIIKLIFPPKEGSFSRDIHDKNYLFWNLRNISKKWALFITASNPFPWLKNRFTLRFFGVKIGKKSLCDTCWISSEFVEIGDNVIIGMGSTLLSFGIEQDKFFLKKINIEDDVVIGAKCVLLPGTIIKKEAKLSAHSYTKVDDRLEENSIYLGHPAKLKEV